MPSEEDVEAQQRRLSITRRTLAHYLDQRAMQGEAYVQPAVVHGIEDTRLNILHIKSALREWGVAVEDQPDDTDNLRYYYIDREASTQDSLVEVVLKGQFSTWSPELQQKVRHLLAAEMEISETSVSIIKAKPGSIILLIKIPEIGAFRLTYLLDQSATVIGEYHIERIRIAEKFAFGIATNFKYETGILNTMIRITTDSSDIGYRLIGSDEIVFEINRLDIRRKVSVITVYLLSHLAANVFYDLVLPVIKQEFVYIELMRLQ